MSNRMNDWGKYPYDEEDDDIEKIPGPKRKKESLSRGEKALIKAIKKSKGVKRSGIAGAFGLQRGRIRY